MSQRHEMILPRKVDALKLTQRAASLKGILQVQDLPRLLQCLSDEVDSDIAVEVNFGRDDEGRRFMTGNLSASLPLLCNRCLQTMNFQVDTDFRLVFVWNDEQAVALPKSLEPVYLQEDGNDLYETLEDELLLCLPLSPLHPEGECQVKLHFPDSGKSDSLAGSSMSPQKAAASAKENPFGVLAQLDFDADKKN